MANGILDFPRHHDIRQLINNNKLHGLALVDIEDNNATQCNNMERHAPVSPLFGLNSELGSPGRGNITTFYIVPSAGCSTENFDRLN
jgi:hypothetical protein